MPELIDFDSLTVEKDSAVCCCGAGFCLRHGTDHLTEDQEHVELLLRLDNQSRGGCRVVRKRLRGDE